MPQWEIKHKSRKTNLQQQGSGNGFPINRTAAFREQIRA
ncbi:Uncharacterised protein [Vibrio cholerae]|nr:Uncharacterised protein [Vibrio cholerae]